MDWNTLAGVVLGAALTYTIQRLIRRDDKATTARLALTGTLQLLWGDTDYQVLKTHLHRTKVQLEDAKVDDGLITEWEEAAWACWRYSTAEYEKHYDPKVGHVGSSELLDAYETLESTVHSELRRKWWKVWSK